MMTGEKDLVWLPKELAAKIKDIDDGAYLEREILNYIEQSKRDLKVNIESIDEDIIQYRAFMIKAKNAFKEAKDEQLDASYALWEKYEDDLKNLRSYVSTAKQALEPLKQELQTIQSLMTNLNTWGIKDLLEVIKTINANYYGETANIIKFLFENYKKKTE